MDFVLLKLKILLRKFVLRIKESIKFSSGVFVSIKIPFLELIFYCLFIFLITCYILIEVVNIKFKR